MNRSEAQKSLIWKSVDRSRARYITQYEKRILTALNRQIAPAIIALKQGKSKPENYVVELQLANVLNELYLKVGVDFAQREYQQHKSNLADYQTKAEEPQSQWLRYVRNWIGTKGAAKVQQITDTTRAFVRKVLDKGASDGLSIPDMAKLMESEADKINRYRATVIARTETISVSNAGSLAGAKSTGLKLNKEWLATRDKRTRSSHSHVDGQTVGMDEVFKVNGYKLEYPGDSSNGAPGSETIQCRCTQVYNPV